MQTKPASFGPIAHSPLCPDKTFWNTFSCSYFTKITNCRDRTQNVRLRIFSQPVYYISSHMWERESWELGLKAGVVLSTHRKSQCCGMLASVKSGYNLITDYLGGNFHRCGISHDVQKKKKKREGGARAARALDLFVGKICKEQWRMGNKNSKIKYHGAREVAQWVKYLPNKQEDWIHLPAVHMKAGQGNKSL